MDATLPGTNQPREPASKRELFKFDYQPFRSHPHQLLWGEIADLLAKYGSPSAKVKLIDRVEEYYRSKLNPSIANYWIGFVHQPPNLLARDHPLSELLDNPKFRLDLNTCLGLWVFSPYLKEVLLARTASRPVPVRQCHLFTCREADPFTWEAFQANPNPYLVFIGQTNRRFDRFYQLSSPYPKSWLSGSDPDESLDYLKKRLMDDHGLDYQPDQPISIQQISSEKYHRLLRDNLAILDFYDCAASNALLECLVRATPVFVNPVGGVVDYLGKGYPLYFDSLDQLEEKLSDNRLIESAHQYLKKIDLKEFSREQFVDSLCDPDLVSIVSKLNQSYMGINKFNQQFASKKGAAKSLGKTNPLSNRLNLKLSNINKKASSVNLSEKRQIVDHQIPLVKIKTTKRTVIKPKPKPKTQAQNSL
jgi:hypothetical protein